MAEYFASRSPEISRREKAHMEAVRALAGECMVLLENNGALPLGAPGGEDIHKLALYGNGARHTVKGGTGSGDVNSRMVVTIEEGLKNAGAFSCIGIFHFFCNSSRSFRKRETFPATHS